MFIGIFPSLREVLAVASCAITVKWMDDAVDAPRDQALGLPNWGGRLGRSLTVYAVAGAVLAMVLDRRWTVALLASAYVVGMAGQWRERQGSGLLGWQESLLAAALATAYLGVGRLWIASLLSMLAIQLGDDWIDGCRSIAWLGGRREQAFWALVAASAALWFKPTLGGTVLVVWLIYAGVEAAWIKGRGEASGHGV